MKYVVTIPIAGHFTVEVEAESQEEAIDKALLADTDEGELEYEQLDTFHEGNVCYCPRPWKIEVQAGEDTEE